MYEKYLNSENDEGFELFRLARNKVNYLRRKPKKQYYEQNYLRIKVIPKEHGELIMR